jgi:dTMP kinase
MFVTFEGVDGSGKSTQVRLLADQLRAEGREVVATREPGGTALGERVRELLLQGTGAAPWAEVALFAAARAQLVDEVIRPALVDGVDVVCDRYIDSSLAYQGFARGLGIKRVLELNLLVTGGLLPDRTLVLRVPVDEATRRRGGEGDRIEREGDEFAQYVDRGYEELVRAFPGRVIEADGTRGPDELAKEIRGRLRDLP